MGDYFSVKEIDNWLKDAGATANDPIVVSGGFRGSYQDSHSAIKLLTLRGRFGETVEIHIPQTPSTKTNSPLLHTQFTSVKGEHWFEVWSSIFVASMLMPPIVDIDRFYEILHSSERVRFVCDTNALCKGVAVWLTHVLKSRAEIVTTSTLEREVQNWVEQDKKFWLGFTTEALHRRTNYRMAWQLALNTEDIVVDRLSPDQSALMLVRSREPIGTGSGKKIPDSDLLMVEQARSDMQLQPRNARVVFLTGDRDCARIATSALGANNVLFAISDKVRAKNLMGRIVMRGWWNPAEPFGSLTIPPVSQLLWNLLIPCAFLTLEFNSKKWVLCPANSVNKGVPSDWTDPHIKVIDVTPKVSHSAKPPEEWLAAPIENNSPPLPLVSDDSPLLLSIPIKSPLSSRALRPSPKYFFNVLHSILFQSLIELPMDSSHEAIEEVWQIFRILEVITKDKQDGARIDEFRRAWRESDLDWFHSELLRFEVYRSAMENIRIGNFKAITTRPQTSLAMAKALGQVASFGEHPFVGDSPLSSSQLTAFLKQALPDTDSRITLEELCRKAAES
ncbi:MAG: hypothetical protein NT023_02915, partial [Armatimonadetes bacterium]|nr:hypothetical protein [Armatimonadota bacterium]